MKRRGHLPPVLPGAAKITGAVQRERKNPAFFRRRGEKNGPASILAGPFPTLPVAYPSLSRPLSATPTVAKRSAKPSKAPICGMTSVSEAPSARMAV